MNLTTSSLYKEIGSGKRVALAKLAVEHFENHGRAFRIAVDISIWQFQIQSGRGGSNPALRTLYYRLLRLHTVGLEALFVFDGSNKPPFKRNKKTSPQNGASLPNFLAKKLIQALGFPFHIAPGEAEAECAALQKAGVVDAVLSEDVDTLMFGASCSLKNWSPSGTKGNKEPTHIDLFDTEVLSRSKLDSDGMVLVALMSGGDYTPDGIPDCGIKIACEAARAGFGKDLVKLLARDMTGVDEWRERLQHELITNEGRHFQRKHKALQVPLDFPNLQSLAYYVKPTISSQKTIDDLRTSIRWNIDIDVAALRVFVQDAFEWHHITGARKLIRGLGPAILTRTLLHRQNFPVNGGIRVNEFHDEESLQEKKEGTLIQAVHSKRNHFATDGEMEVKISYLPMDVVSLDLSVETEPEIQGYDNEVSGTEGSISDDERVVSVIQSPRKPRARPQFDPSVPQKLWILESYLKIGVPLILETWEEEMQNPKKFAARKSKARKQLQSIQLGAMERYVKVSKPGILRRLPLADGPNPGASDIIPPAPTAKRNENAEMLSKSTPTQFTRQSSPKKTSKIVVQDQPSTTDPGTNPWTLARSKATFKRATLPKPATSSARQMSASCATQHTRSAESTILITSSPPPERVKRSVTSSNTEAARIQGVDPPAQHAEAPSVAGGEAQNNKVRSPSPSPSPPPSPSYLFRPEASRILDVEAPRPVSTVPLQMSQREPPMEIEIQPCFPHPCLAQGTAIGNPKRSVTIRESLEGAWTVGESDGPHGRTRRRVFPRVSMVDLTTDD